MSTANKLQYLIDAKISISAAIEAKGGEVPQELSGYGPAIEALPSGTDPEKLTYVLYEDNTISSYLLEGRVSGKPTPPYEPLSSFQNAKVVQLGNEISSIGQCMCYGVSSLTAITIPDSVQRINERSFWRCYGLSSISIPGSVKLLGYTTVTYGPFGNYLERNAADACSNLVSVDLGNGIETIGGGCFANCVNLPSITIPDSVTWIHNYAFEHCHSLTSITLPNNLTRLGGYAFESCYNMSSINLGNSVSSIQGNTFEKCYSLSSITIPDSVQNILQKAFLSCTALTSIMLGNGISSIGNYAFSDCTSLPSITIPSSVTSIGSYAFIRCSSCSTFDFSSATAVPTLGNTNAFSSTPADKKIIVPDALYDQWKAANNWNSSTNGIVDAITKASEA